LSGAPTREVSTELIRKTYALYGKKLVIIGIGGVFSARDAYEKIRAGASLVGLVTGLVFEGPQIVGQINADLVRLLRHDGYETISEAIGVDAR
jgi:dihydroorotate dehydrogenase